MGGTNGPRCGGRRNAGRLHTARGDCWRGRPIGVGVEVDRATKNTRTTPLIQAATQHVSLGSPEILLQHRADVNLARNDGVTPLFLAAQVGSVELTQVLLVHGTEVNQANKSKSTPLHQAACHGHVTVVRLLLENQAGRHLEEPVDTYTAG